MAHHDAAVGEEDRRVGAAERLARVAEVLPLTWLGLGAEREVGLGARVGDDDGALDVREAARRRADDVLTDREIAHRVAAHRVGACRAHRAGVVDDRHARPRDAAALVVDDPAGDPGALAGQRIDAVGAAAGGRDQERESEDPHRKWVAARREGLRSQDRANRVRGRALFITFRWAYMWRARSH